MKYFLSILFIFSLNLVSPLLAQDKNSADMSALLENKNMESATSQRQTLCYGNGIPQRWMETDLSI